MDFAKLDPQVSFALSCFFLSIKWHAQLWDVLSCFLSKTDELTAPIGQSIQLSSSFAIGDIGWLDHKKPHANQTDSGQTLCPVLNVKVRCYDNNNMLIWLFTN